MVQASTKLSCSHCRNTAAKEFILNIDDPECITINCAFTRKRGGSDRCDRCIYYAVCDPQAQLLPTLSGDAADLQTILEWLEELLAGFEPASRDGDQMMALSHRAEFARLSEHLLKAFNYAEVAQKVVHGLTGTMTIINRANLSAFQSLCMAREQLLLAQNPAPAVPAASAAAIHEVHDSVVAVLEEAGSLSLDELSMPFPVRLPEL
ncbi:hypothetical protein AAL_05929 [Moelleriella libera RCEF 2490]|uniref:Uncharacterized protein n=1 Tax=Moelleriella libera RCEF 2490 TaxID=1081109 RepID=A0A167ZNC5_9HYPO|nr:hypothetical protein AAL_05929 [Moelleriella libera RCEF 2490]